MRARHRVFVLLGFLLFLAIASLVTFDWHALEEARERAFDDTAKNIETFFALSLDQITTSLCNFSLFVANDEQVQQAFLKGKRAVESEGGGKGGKQAAAARQELLDLLQEPWAPLKERSKYRQLHFHLSPGATSFLRVHKPDKFGDDLRDVRHTIVDANTDKQGVCGFETGRVVSGIRGVEPVFANDPDTGERIHVGAVETGISFQSLLDRMAEQRDLHIAVMLNMVHLKGIVWDELLGDMLAESPPVGIFYPDATTDSAMTNVISADLLQTLWNGLNGDKPSRQIVMRDQCPWLVTAFPVRDYAGKKDPARANIGMVVAWKKECTAFLAHRRAVKRLILLGLLVWGVTLGFLYIGLILERDFIETMGTTYKAGGVLRGILSFAAGALLLAGISTLQKMTLGIPVVWHGYAAPFFFGGIAGWGVSSLVAALARRTIAFQNELNERKRIQESIQRQDALLQAVSRASHVLLSEENVDVAVPGALELVGRVTRQDRVYLFECHQDPDTGENLMSQRYEWVRDGVSVQMDNPELQNLSFDTLFPRWHALLSKGEVVEGCVAEFPEGERSVLEPQDIVSLLVVPVFVDTKFWGFVGFDNCHSNYQWGEGERAILITLASSLGAAVTRHRAGEELRLKREQFELAVEGSNDGIWDWNLRNNDLYLSPRWKEQLGYKDEELKNHFSSFESLIYEEDKARLMTYVENYLKGGATKYQIEFRMKHKDGSLRWIQARGMAVHNKEGLPVRMAGSHTDITESRKAEEEKRKSYEESQRLNRLMLGREDRVLELKREVNQLLIELGRQEKYGTSSPERK